MIELSPTAAIMVYLCITLATLLGIWGYHHYRSRRKKVILIEQKLYVCEYCQLAYLDQIIKFVTQCPQCQSYNKNNAHFGGVTFQSREKANAKER